MIDKVETNCSCSPIFASMVTDEAKSGVKVKPKCIGNQIKCMEVCIKINFFLMRQFSLNHKFFLCELFV